MTAPAYAPEVAGCPGRYHRTYTAARKAGCICPTAVRANHERERARPRNRRVATPRRRDIDPTAVEQALDGYIPARNLTTDERRAVVTALTRRGLTDLQIADRLRWSGGGRRGKSAVARFRWCWDIPAGSTHRTGTVPA